MSSKRNANIELLRIFAMLIIVIGHCRPSSSVGIDFCVDVSTYKIDEMLVTFLGYFGAFGNAIFIIISSYFLCDSKKGIDKNKIIRLISDLFFFSYLFLLIYSLTGESIQLSLLIKSIFPIFYGVSWYISCYILLYLIHPILNYSIDCLDKNMHLKICMTMFFIHFVIQFILPHSYLYFNQLFGFIEIYYITCYVKKYMMKYFSYSKNTVYFICSQFCCVVCLFLFLNFVGLKFAILSSAVKNISYFYFFPIFLCSLSVVFFVVNLKQELSAKKGQLCTDIAQLLLIVYIIHDNLLFANYTRAEWFTYMFFKFGHNSILWSCLIFSMMCFIFSLIIAFFYRRFVTGFYYNLTDFAYQSLKKVFYKIYYRLYQLE